MPPRMRHLTDAALATWVVDGEGSRRLAVKHHIVALQYGYIHRIVIREQEQFRERDFDRAGPLSQRQGNVVLSCVRAIADHPIAPTVDSDTDDGARHIVICCIGYLNRERSAGLESVAGDSVRRHGL